MNVLLTFLLLFPFIPTLSAQDGLNIDLTYPYALDRVTNSDNKLRGIFDLGLGYRFLEFGEFKVGGSMHYGYLIENIDPFFVNGNVSPGAPFTIDGFTNTYGNLQPKLFIESTQVESVKPSLSFGYSLLTIAKPETQNLDGTMIPLRNFNLSGMHIGAGLAILFSNSLGGQINYSFQKVIGEQPISQNRLRDINDNLPLLKGGITYHFN